MVPDHVAREAGGKLTRYATTEEDEATLRELLLRYVTHPRETADSFLPMYRLHCIGIIRSMSMCLPHTHLGLASQISFIADMTMRLNAVLNHFTNTMTPDL